MAESAGKNIDMICQHNSDGSIIPIKIRMEDDDGMMQEYKVRAYKDLQYKGNTPDVGHMHTYGIFPFDVKIESFGRERTLSLFYNSYEHTWTLSRQT